MTSDQQPAGDRTQPSRKLTDQERELINLFITLTLALGRLGIEEAIQPPVGYLRSKPSAMQNLVNSLTEELARRETRRRIALIIIILAELQFYMSYLDYLLKSVDDDRR